jgi:hypothetical protein
MILTAHQPVYLPWLGFFHKIALSDGFCYFDDVQYLKKDWNNRNKIKTSNGELWLTVPVFTKGHREKTINKIEINNSINWQEKHWRSIYLTYGKSPFFYKYSDYFEDVYKKEWHYLTELNEYMLKFFLKELGIDVAYYKASELSFEGYKSELVLDMCRKLDADLYIFGSLGKDYVDTKAFEENNINVYFQDYRHPTYSQLRGDFISHLSIIDLLFNVGKDRALGIIMEGNITKNELRRMYQI